MEILKNNNVIENIYNLLPYTKLIILLRVNKIFHNDIELKELMKEKRAEKIALDIYEYFITRVYNKYQLKCSLDKDVSHYVQNIAFVEMKLSRLKYTIDDKIKNKILKLINELYCVLVPNKIDRIDFIIINRIISQMTKYIN